jgi:hypothetical protein
MRYPTQHARQKLNEVLNLPNESWIQDWDIQLADPNRVEEFCQLYLQLTNDDERFTLMTLIVASCEELLQNGHSDKKLSELVISLLTKQFDLHKDTIEYWCELEEDNPEHFFAITSIMRAIWQEKAA